MEIISFGKEQTYPFYEVLIDEKFGYPIYVNGILVGGILINSKIVNNEIVKNLKFCGINGIEIDKQFRNKGIASAIIENLKKEYDAIYGTITEESSVMFWEKTNATIFELPFQIPDPLKDTVHIEKPLVFYITTNNKAQDYLNIIFSKLKIYNKKNK